MPDARRVRLVQLASNFDEMQTVERLQLDRRIDRLVNHSTRSSVRQDDERRTAEGTHWTLANMNGSRSSSSLDENIDRSTYRRASSSRFDRTHTSTNGYGRESVHGRVHATRYLIANGRRRLLSELEQLRPGVLLRVGLNFDPPVALVRHAEIFA